MLSCLLPCSCTNSVTQITRHHQVIGGQPWMHALQHAQHALQRSTHLLRRPAVTGLHRCRLEASAAIEDYLCPGTVCRRRRCFILQAGCSTADQIWHGSHSSRALATPMEQQLLHKSRMAVTKPDRQARSARRTGRRRYRWASCQMANALLCCRVPHCFSHCT